MAGYEIGVQICEGLEVTNDRPSVERGDWFRTAVGAGHCCRMYCLPGDGLLGNVPEGTYIGPVHDVWESRAFVTVLVPRVALSPDAPELVWISVWKAHNRQNYWGRPQAFAHKCTRAELERWRQNGWQNVYYRELDEPPQTSASRRLT